MAEGVPRRQPNLALGSTICGAGFIARSGMRPSNPSRSPDHQRPRTRAPNPDREAAGAAATHGGGSTGDIRHDALVPHTRIYSVLNAAENSMNRLRHPLPKVVAMARPSVPRCGPTEDQLQRWIASAPIHEHSNPVYIRHPHGPATIRSYSSRSKSPWSGDSTAAAPRAAEAHRGEEFPVYHDPKTYS